MEHAVEEGSRARQDGPGRRVEVLVERHVDGVERPGQLGDVHPGIGALQEHARPVQMQPDLFPAGERGDPIEFPLVERFPGAPPDRRLDRDHRDRSRDAPATGAVHDLLDRFEGEGCLSGGQRNQRDRTQRLHAVPGVVVEVSLGLDDRPPAAGSGEGAHREMIGQRPRRHEDRAFLPQDRRELLLQSLNRAAIGIGIAMDPAFVRHPRQEASLFGGSQTEPVSGHAHPPRVGSEGGQRGGATRRRRGSEEARAESEGSGLQEASSGEVVHGVLTLRAHRPQITVSASPGTGNFDDEGPSPWQKAAARDGGVGEGRVTVACPAT